MNSKRSSFLQLKTLLPVIILLLGAGIAWRLMTIHSEQPQPAPPNPPPTVKVIRANPQRLALNVRSQGVVTPRTEIDLIPEVTGRVTRLHPAFVTGAPFKAGDLLVTIDPRDYDHAITQAQARIAQAKRQLALEQEEADQARYEWRVLGGDKPPTPLMLHKPQLVEARANLKAAEADLAHAQLQRSRCEWRAPFVGRVREKLVGIGQFVQPGTVLARLYATDVAEVRLPLTMDQLAFIDWPTRQPNQETAKSPDTARTPSPEVKLTAQFSGIRQQWQGRIARIEGAFNETTGLLFIVAEIDLTKVADENNIPLLPGLFVQAEIVGRPQNNLFVLPRQAINRNRDLLLVDQDQRLRMRSVDIVRIEADYILVNGGLSAGELVVASSVHTPIEGLKVRPDIVESDLEWLRSPLTLSTSLPRTSE